MSLFLELFFQALSVKILLLLKLLKIWSLLMVQFKVGKKKKKMLFYFILLAKYELKMDCFKLESKI